MRVDEKILPKRTKFTRLQKQEWRANTLAISLSQAKGHPTYVNVQLASYFRKNGIERVFIYTDPEGEAIAVEPTKSQDGFPVRQDSGGSGGLTANLRQVMPEGRYVFREDKSSPKQLVFCKEYVTYHYGKSPDAGASKTPTKGTN